MPRRPSQERFLTLLDEHKKILYKVAGLGPEADARSLRIQPERRSRFPQLAGAVRGGEPGLSSAKCVAGTFGNLKLTLHPSSWDYDFESAAGTAVSDLRSGIACHN